MFDSGIMCPLKGILIHLLSDALLDSGSTGVIVFIYYLYNSLFSVMFFIELSILVIMFIPHWHCGLFVLTVDHWGVMFLFKSYA